MTYASFTPAAKVQWKDKNFTLSQHFLGLRTFFSNSASLDSIGLFAVHRISEFLVIGFHTFLSVVRRHPSKYSSNLPETFCLFINFEKNVLDFINVQYIFVLQELCRMEQEHSLLGGKSTKRKSSGFSSASKKQKS